MFRRLTLVAGGMLLLAVLPVQAQQAREGKLYGQGTHAFYAGDYVKSHQLLTAAIEANADDPRPFYFRGMVYLKLSRPEDARLDFRKAAALEATDVNTFYGVSKALSRVQGNSRLVIERYRAQARLAARKQAKKIHRARFEEIRSQESRVVRKHIDLKGEPLVEIKKDQPVPDTPLDLPPAGSGTGGGGEKNPFDNKGAEANPFAEPAGGDPGENPFDSPGADKGEEPSGDSGADDGENPFGGPGADKDEKASDDSGADKPETEPSGDPKDNPFGDTMSGKRPAVAASDEPLPPMTAPAAEEKQVAQEPVKADEDPFADPKPTAVPAEPAKKKDLVVKISEPKPTPRPAEPVEAKKVAQSAAKKANKPVAGPAPSTTPVKPGDEKKVAQEPTAKPDNPFKEDAPPKVQPVGQGPKSKRLSPKLIGPEKGAKEKPAQPKASAGAEKPPVENPFVDE